MKRYNVDVIKLPGNYYVGLNVSDNGDLVKYDDAAAEIEKLKCCGNCKHLYSYGTSFCTIADGKYSAHEKCKFTPSRWELYQQ